MDFVVDDVSHSNVVKWIGYSYNEGNSVIECFLSPLLIGVFSESEEFAPQVEILCLLENTSFPKGIWHTTQEVTKSSP